MGRLTLISDCQGVAHAKQESRYVQIRWTFNPPSYLNALFTAKPVAWQGLLPLGASLEYTEPAFNRRHLNAGGDYKLPARHPSLPAKLGDEGNRWRRITVSPVAPDRGQTPPAASWNKCAGANQTFSGRRRDTSFPVRRARPQTESQSDGYQ